MVPPVHAALGGTNEDPIAVVLERTSRDTMPAVGRAPAATNPHGLKERGTEAFKRKQYAAAGAHYEAALLALARQRLLLAMTNDRESAGPEWAGSNVRFPAKPDREVEAVAYEEDEDDCVPTKKTVKRFVAQLGPIHEIVQQWLMRLEGDLQLVLRSNRAECMLRLERWADAFADAEAALRIDSQHEKSQHRLGRAAGRYCDAANFEPMGTTRVCFAADVFRRQGDLAGAHPTFRSSEVNDAMNIESFKTDGIEPDQVSPGGGNSGRGLASDDPACVRYRQFGECKSSFFLCLSLAYEAGRPDSAHRQQCKTTVVLRSQSPRGPGQTARK